MRVLANTGKNIERLPAVRLGVMHAIRRHEWQPEFRSEINQLFIYALVVTQKMALDFDEDIVAPEDVDEKLRASFETPGSARDSRVVVAGGGDPGGEQRGHGTAGVTAPGYNAR